jgi:hypothetical protein
MRTAQLQKLAKFMVAVALEATHQNAEEAAVVMQLSRDTLIVYMAQPEHNEKVPN